MYPDDDLLPISALQHFLFCPRQCALIHIEQVWMENALTAEGRAMHEKVHEADDENRPGLRIVRGLRIRSLEMGLIGQADVVEFHSSPTGILIPHASGLWMPFPVEYKRGKPKIDRCDEVQLAAQAMCLEEMLNIPVQSGAFFYGEPRRRTQVEFSSDLRQLTRSTSLQLHELIDARLTPPAKYEKKCKACSLYDLCRPKTTGIKKNLVTYMNKAYEELTAEE